MTLADQPPALLEPGMNIAVGFECLYLILDIGDRYIGPHTGEAMAWSAAPYFSLCRGTWIPTVIVWDTQTGEFGRFEGDDRASYKQALGASKEILAQLEEVGALSLLPDMPTGAFARSAYSGRCSVRKTVEDPELLR